MSLATPPTTHLSGSITDGVVWCLHGEPAAHFTSRTPRNPGREFYKCPREPSCRFWKWADEIGPTPTEFRFSPSSVLSLSLSAAVSTPATPNNLGRALPPSHIHTQLSAEATAQRLARMQAALSEVQGRVESLTLSSNDTRSRNIEQVRQDQSPSPETGSSARRPMRDISPSPARWPAPNSSLSSSGTSRDAVAAGAGNSTLLPSPPSLEPITRRVPGSFEPNDEGSSTSPSNSIAPLAGLDISAVHSRSGSNRALHDSHDNGDTSRAPDHNHAAAVLHHEVPKSIPDEVSAFTSRLLDIDQDIRQLEAKLAASEQGNANKQTRIEYLERQIELLESKIQALRKGKERCNNIESQS